MYTQLEEGEEPEWVFASAAGGIVCIKWQTDEKGFRFFRPTPGIFSQGNLFQTLAAPSVVNFLRSEAPERRAIGSARPKNAFRVEIHLRKSDEDELGHVTNSKYVSLIHDVLTFGLRTGYYANGSGIQMTQLDLPVDPEHQMVPASTAIAVPAGSAFYKKGKVFEFYTGYERELKVKPEVHVWSWVEPQRIGGEFDVIRFEICATDAQGQEQIVSLCRTIVRDDTRLQASL